MRVGVGVMLLTSIILLSTLVFSYVRRSESIRTFPTSLMEWETRLIVS